MNLNSLIKIRLLISLAVVTPCIIEGQEVICADRPLERPHILSKEGKELEHMKMLWGTGSHHLRYKVLSPKLAACLGLSLDKIRQRDAPHKAAWRAVEVLRMSIEKGEQEGHWTVTTGLGAEEYRLDTSTRDTPPWEMIEQIHTWLFADTGLVESSIAEREEFKNALWTLWVEAYLAALPMEYSGYPLADFSSFMYVDEIDERLSKSDERQHRPGFTPLMVAGRMMVGGVFDPRLFQAGIKDGQWVTKFMSRPIREWNRGELFDWWVREERFEYVLEIEGHPEQIHLDSSSYATWDIAVGFLPGIAYVRIAKFTPMVIRRFREHVMPPIHEHKLKGLIMDLRSNEGGREQIGLLDLFFPPGEPSASWVKLGSFEAHAHQNPGTTYYDIPLVVLIDGDTGSMAEVFVAAVRQKQRGILVGEKTWGKGVAQALMPFGQEGILKLVHNLQYFPGTRKSWHGQGIAPDIEITPGPRADEVAAMLRRPLADVERLVQIDPVFKQAVRLFRVHHPKWAERLKPYRPKVPRQVE